MASLKYSNSNSLGHKRDLAPIGCGDWDLSSTLVSGRLQHHEYQQSEKLFSAALKYLEDKGRERCNHNAFCENAV